MIFRNLAIFLTVCGSIFAQEDSLGEELLYKEPQAVLFVDEDKMYVNPEEVHVTHLGLFLGTTQIPAVMSDGNGCFIPAMGTIRKKESKRVTYMCLMSKCSLYETRVEADEMDVYCPGFRDGDICKIPRQLVVVKQR